MSLRDRISKALSYNAAPIVDGERAFVTGPAVVETFDATFGRDQSVFSPAEYGDYVATSSGVYVCVTKRAKAVSSLPIDLKTKRKDGSTDKVQGGPLRDLLDKVNPFWTFGQLLEMTEMSLCQWGSAFWFLERGNSGTRPPTEIWWARPDKVKVVPDPTNYVKGFLLESVNGGQDIAYTPTEVIWFRYANPIDEYSGLAPLAAARLAADMSSAAMQANRNIFANGVMMAGMVGPADSGVTFTKEQGQELEEGLSRRLKGVNNAHRVAVLRANLKFQPMSLTPKDAEFLGGLKWALEDIARAFGIPPDLVGGERTYANAKEARYAFWEDTIKPEARFIANVITEQLLPMFPGTGRADLAEFDLSNVQVLQELEDAKWTREKEQIEKGVIVVNAWRESKGLDPVPWGDDWWAPIGMTPVGGPMAMDVQAMKAAELAAMATVIEVQPPALEPGDEPQDRAMGRRNARSMAYGSPDHERAWRAFVTRTEPHERAVADVTADLLRRQRKSILAKLGQRGQRDAADLAGVPFDKARWTKEFRATIRPVLTEIVDDVGTAALDDLGIGISFDVKDPNVIRFLEGRAQRFAREVNETTYTQLQVSLSEGIDAGESIDDLAKRVEAVMGDRIRSSATTIARTETQGAAVGGTIESFRQAEVVQGVEWIAALDDRTRDTHISAHGQRRKLGDDFNVGGASGPGPGLMGEASEDVNCRCSLLAILDTEEL